MPDLDILDLLDEQQRKDVLYAREHFLGGENLSEHITPQELEIVASYYKQQTEDGTSRNIATVVIGPPGAGKSTLIGLINEKCKDAGYEQLGILSDCDELKPKITALYPDKDLDSDDVHRKSRDLQDVLRDQIYENEDSFVQPILGLPRQRVAAFVGEASKQGYDVNLISVEISSEKSVQRVADRLGETRDDQGNPTGQYTDPEWAYDAAAELVGVYDFCKQHLSEQLNGYALYNNENISPVLVEAHNFPYAKNKEYEEESRLEIIRLENNWDRGEKYIER